MNLDEMLWIDRLRGPSNASSGADASLDPGAFQRVLQQAQDESAPASAQAGAQASTTDQTAAEVSDFTAALQRAETQFTALMDLRRQLEAAFKSRMP